MFLKPALNATVPFEVQRLFEVARGSMIYGYFFYPLYTLASEQLARVAESAVHCKCEMLGASNTVKKGSFADKVEYLIEQQVINVAEKESWTFTKDYRNSASHPRQQSIHTPHDALLILRDAAMKINELFPSE